MHLCKRRAAKVQLSQFGHAQPQEFTPCPQFPLITHLVSSWIINCVNGHYHDVLFKRTLIEKSYFFIVPFEMIRFIAAIAIY